MANAETLIGTQFGHDLRQAREARSRSLAWLSAETKVSLDQLHALEQGHLDELPGGIFRRGIVKAYLKAVGLEEQEWMPRFQLILETQVVDSNLNAEPEAWQQFAENVRRGRQMQKNTHGLRWLGITVLMSLVVLAAWAVWHFEVRHRLGETQYNQSPTSAPR